MCGNTVAREGGQGGIRMIWGYGDKETTGGLRIEEQVLIFGRDIRFELGALANEGAVVF